MYSNKRLGWATMLSVGVLSVASCAEEAPPPATLADPGTVLTPDPAAQQDTEQAEAQAIGLQREVFTYQSAGRDPFASLLRTGAVRPLLEDLRVTSINYDNQFPMNSVAIMSDTRENERYAVRVGDQLGRMRVTTIRVREVVLAYEEFGRELQDTLRLGGN